MKNSTSSVIELNALKKIYFTDDIETHALAGIDLTINEGEFVALSGPSGCGKSTLLSILGLLDTANSGRYILNGKDVSNLSNGQRAKIRNADIGFIFQNFNLIGEISVSDNIELPLIYAKVPKKERQVRVDEALEQVGMSHRKNHLPGQLSGGQQQRVAIARAIVSSPSILLADEPTGNLDSENGEAIMHLLVDLHKKGSTICMVTHDPRYLNAAQRLIYLLDGEILPSKTPTPIPQPPQINQIAV